MEPANIVWLALVACAAVAIVVDVVLAVKREPTMSQQVWKYSKLYPMLPLGVGLLVGGLLVHLFWR